MNEHADTDRSRAERVGQELAIRKQQRRLAGEERDLERHEQKLKDAEEHAKAQIEEELRKEHWGQEPERPLSWPDED